MKIIEPSVEYWPQGAGMEEVWNQIARATRVCYQSKPREGESSEDFVKRVILKSALIEGNLNDLAHCRFNFDKMHGAMLEHGTVYLTLKEDDVYTSVYEIAYDVLFNLYSRFNFDIINGLYHITTNMRVILENNLVYALRYMCKPTDKHDKRYTFSVITDIGVTREMNRHRTFSIAEQSTRYCDFNKDKFGDDIIFIQPNWLGNDIANEELIKAYTHAELYYKALRKLGYRPEQARQVLPLGVKTQAVYTAFADDWEHFLKLRADNVSGKVHPNMQFIANKIKDIIEHFK